MLAQTTVFSETHTIITCLSIAC